jgi:adenylate cyclase
VAFVQADYWIYTVQPVLIAASVFVLNALVQYRVSEKDRAFVRKAMTGYVSKQVMQRLLDNPSALELGGVQVDATVLFSDIVGFSSISERMTPPDLTALLNAYFTRIGDAVMAHDGMIDKYIGDAVMAVWGAPLPDPAHARKACAAALEMKRVAGETGGPLNSRIGINTGPMMAGNLGHRDRMSYTVIGDAVNLASRVEGVNKLYGTAILATESTVALTADDFIFRLVDRIRVVGKQDPVSVFELVARADDESAAAHRAKIQSFGGILAAYDRREWSGALDAAARHLAAYPGSDPVVDLYMERCRHFEAAPPPADWDGVYTSKSK